MDVEVRNQTGKLLKPLQQKRGRNRLLPPHTHLTHPLPLPSLLTAPSDRATQRRGRTEPIQRHVPNLSAPRL